MNSRATALGQLSCLPAPSARTLARRRPCRRSFGPTTKWQTIREAGAAGPQRREAFASLYRSYHPPVFEFIQRQGVPPARAADIAQDFFVRLFTKPDLERL